jgi:hypothetical protein
MAKSARVPTIAALLMAGSPWVAWWTKSESNTWNDVVERVSLYERVVCRSGTCESYALPPSWSTYGWATLVVVLFAALVAGVLAQRRRMDKDVKALERVVRFTCRAVFAMIVVAIGWAVVDQNATPSFGPIIAGTGAGLALYAAAYDPFEISDAAVGTPAPDLRAARAAATAQLRFTVEAAAIETDGLRAGDRLLAWRDVVRVVARRLPPDPPWEKATFVDLVPATGAPVRIGAATRIDFSALPGGAAPTAKGNWRRLVAVARHANEAIAIDDDSMSFFHGGQAPVFPAWKTFLEYDAQYDA